MTQRTELWVGAVPPAGWPTVTLANVGELPGDGPAAVIAHPLEHAPQTFPVQVHRALRAQGRGLDAVVVGAEVLDLTDGLPLDVGVGAHRRAAWIEVADRVRGTVTPLMSRLQPGLEPYSEQRPAQWDPHSADRRAAWVSTLAKRTRSPGTLLLEAHRPLQPGAFVEWMMSDWPGVERAVGFVWTEDRPNVVVRLERAGVHPMVSGAGEWWVNSPRRYWPRETQELLRLKQTWHPDFGDRICRIAVIGESFDPAVLSVQFEQALISEARAESWHGSATSPDPFAGLL